ncbi:oxidoreductase [Psychromonas sp. psych-6C06]|uniref:Gfo/Idh/MocA family protein n=1 Tax=Psychromonas sp. psych-6C06 TaxID=2058089 RepID=UPI000C337EDB|nr:Gfo/Idh/MocA family oxidoreductase [Psychromonas sp. psych-6C06]PKF62174.1 oxidoreductase [Psychromonas sp. psych-6C06]
MINFAVIGSNWITEKFVNATRVDNALSLRAVYSRTLKSAQLFADKFSVSTCYDDLQTLADDDDIKAVYIASPNSLHFEQSMQMLKAGKHVICEKPLASNAAQVEQLFDVAIENGVILFEAYMSAHLPNFKQVKNNLNKISPIRKANIHYCQYSSRYPAYLAGNNPNTFNPQFSNGSIMDIGYYCIAFTVALFGKPKKIQAQAHLLQSGVDGCGTVILDYGDFIVTVDHSKISNSTLDNEIQGENGNLTIKHVALCEKVTLTQQESLDLTLEQNENSMSYEAQFFAKQIIAKQIDEEAMQRAKTTAAVITEIRRLTGVKFPADNK